MKFRALLSVRWLALAGTFAAPLALECAAQVDGLDIAVRAVIADGLADKTTKKQFAAEFEAGRGRKFVMYPAVEVYSGHKLAYALTPDTITAMLATLQEQLAGRGYVAVSEKDKPEVLVTLQYGRGILASPHDDALQYDNTGGGRSLPPTLGFPGYRMWEPGHEAKAQAALWQKLFLTVSAWDFASMQKGQKPKRLWSTTMNVDDPDHRDFTHVYKQMIAAGAPFFNSEIKSEVVVPTAIRDGRVEIGPTRVVPDAKPATK